jgi:hypothetical protein
MPQMRRGKMNPDTLVLEHSYMHKLDSLPSEWQQHTHLDGKPYFQHLEWRVVTEAYMRNPVVRAKLAEWYHQIDTARSTKRPQWCLSKNQELYLTLNPKPGYYFVDHDTQSIFWLDDVPLRQLGLSEQTCERGPTGSFSEDFSL